MSKGARLLTILRGLLVVLLFAPMSIACPPTDDDDSGFGDRGLCTGPGCANADECPDEEPLDGDACDFLGNCHYCSVDTVATGYTCDATTFTQVGVYDCTTDAR